MNLFFRFLWLMTMGRLRTPCHPLGPCRTPFRVLPTDLDLQRHVNNGVYLSMMDLARIDLLQRAGLLRRIQAKGWYPVVTAQTIQYRRSLTLFQRFEIVTRVLAWDDKTILLEQQFERGAETIAHGLVRGRFLSRGGSVPLTELIVMAGNPQPPTDVPEYALRWNTDQESWQGR